MELRRSAKDPKVSPLKKDTVGWYLDSIKSSDVLSHEELVELFKKREAGDAAATNQIVFRNLKLVVAVARTYRDKGVPWEDLIQEGNLGLIHAVEKFEWQRGNRFSTYAMWWIRQRISHHLATHKHDIRVPTHALRLRKHIEEAAKKLAKDGESDPSWERIAQIVGSSADVVEATMQGAKNMYSLSQPETQSEKDHLESRFVKEHTFAIDEPEHVLASTELREVILAASSMLDDTERRVIELRVDGNFSEELNG